MTTYFNWSKVFETQYPVAGASVKNLSEVLAALFAPLSGEELASIARSQTNPFPISDPLHSLYRQFDPLMWQLPTRPLPPSYITFLRWSNGGSFFNNNRHFDPFLASYGLRQNLVGYHIPQYMPNAMPFAFSGRGHVFLFDMRSNYKNDEYPILFASLGNLRFEQSTEVGKSFIDVCSGNTDPQDKL